MCQPKLKPCPFCGNETPSIQKFSVYVRICCSDCGIQTPDYHQGDIELNEIIDDWNARVSVDTSEHDDRDDTIQEQERIIKELVTHLGLITCQLKGDDNFHNQQSTYGYTYSLINKYKK